MLAALHIRRLLLENDDEAAAAVAVQRAAYEIEAALIGSRGMPGLREGAAELRAAASREIFWGAFDDNRSRLVGVMGLEDEQDESGQRCVRISRLAVDPMCFRRGVGRALVRQAIRQAGERVFPVRVSTGAANAPGRALYESEGFSTTGSFTAPDGTPLVMLTRPS